MTSIPAIDRIWARVRKNHKDDSCWDWPGAIGRDGYGHVRDGEKIRAVHRVVFESENNVSLDLEEHVMHTCDNTICCRPSHLKLGDRLLNMEDMVTKQRNRTPRPGNGYTKIHDKRAVVELFLTIKNKSEVARRFGITAPRVAQIVKEFNVG